MFYDNFLLLCKQKGVAPSRAAVEAGLSKSTVTRWKSSPESTPTGSVLEALARYFQVPVSELLSEKEKPTTDEGDELNEYLEVLKNRPECRMLFQLAKGATKEEVEQAVKIIEALRK